MGGDEFTLVVEHLNNSLDSVATATKVLAALSEPFDLDGTILKTTASIGISIYPNDGTNPESLLQYADIAMYRAKQIRNNFQFYTPLEIV
jgi:diguanylate cyclase (GGDEF)-like protein